MGRIYLFTCPRCEYQAKVAGGPDEGFHCATQTILCRDCRALHDVVVRLRVAEAVDEARRRPAGAENESSPRRSPGPPPDLATTVPLMLLFGGQKRTRWTQLKLRCPVSRLHWVELWSAPGKCPRCATHLERTGMPWRIWD
jgi:hypothetical protein